MRLKYKEEGNYQDGGTYDPYSPMTKEERKFQRGMERYDEGVKGMLKKEMRQRDREAFRTARRDPDGYYPALDSETSILLEMLESGQLNEEDAMRIGKRRRLGKQVGPFAAEAALGLLASGKVAQSKAERQGLGRPKFGRALLSALGLI